ncbi:MAG: hypothetical protein ABIL05_03405, partial [candidate division WOR-3 bacterium]
RLNCRTFNHEDYEGRLIQISGVRTDSLILKGNRNYYLYDTSGVCIMRVHINTEIPGNIACADTFSIIGIKGQYDYSSRPDSFYEIFPRSAADFSRLTEVLNLSINEVQTPDSEGYDSKYKGCYVRIRGVVTGPDTIFGPGSLTSFFIQDSTGGINIYGADGDALAEKMADTLGAGFEIVGVVSEYNGLTEITRGWMRYLGPGMMPSPTFIPYNQFVQEIIEGRLVEVIGTVFEEPNISGSGRNFVVKNGYPAITVRVNNTVYTSLENVKAGKVLRIRGIAGQYDSEPPFDIGYQISIRFADDIAETSSTGFSREPVIESIEPNPFAPEIGEVARIRISSPPNFRLTLDLYNLNGKKVRSLLNEGQAGRQEVLWDGRDEARGRCPTGIYLVNLKAVSPEGKTYYRRRLIVLGTRF